MRKFIDYEKLLNVYNNVNLEGSGWVIDDFIKSSLSDERGTPSTLETITLTAGPSGVWYSDLYGATFVEGDTVPAHLVKGYNKI